MKVIQEVNKYRINQVSISTLCFKLLMSKAMVDTRAIASYLHKNLTLLEQCIETVNSNIELFN